MMLKRGNIFITFFLLFLILNVPFSTALREYNLTYDAAGNLIHSYNKVYQYNSYNQLSQVNDTAGNVLEKYEYNHVGNRVVKIEFNSSGSNTTIFYVDNDFVRIVNSTGTYDEVYYYDQTDLVAVRKGSDMYYHHPDHLGSSSLVTNSTGGIVEETTYFPFGDILDGGDTSRFGYTGKEDDTVGHLYFGARYYDPVKLPPIFTQPDDRIPNVYDPQQLNRYSYVRNNPYKYTDPSGHCIEDACIGEAALAAYIGWKVWGAFLSLVPVGQYTIDPNSVSTEQLGGAATDAGISLLPISGDTLTAINTILFVEHPIKYLTDPSYPISPGTRIVSLFTSEEKNVESNGDKIKTPQKIDNEVKGTSNANAGNANVGTHNDNTQKHPNSISNGLATALARFWDRVKNTVSGTKKTQN